MTDFEGFVRILTVLSRGYIFHDKNGGLLAGDPYARVDHASSALLAWRSTPDKNESVPFMNCGELADRFPELVNSNGEGWYYRHIQNIIRFVKNQSDAVSENAKNTVAGISKGFKAEWKKKARQLQVPIFALNTKAAWAMRLGDILADALELGALRTEEYVLPQPKYYALKSLDLNTVPLKVLCDTVAYYDANKSNDNEWVVLPVASFDCYYETRISAKNGLPKSPTLY